MYTKGLGLHGSVIKIYHRWLNTAEFGDISLIMFYTSSAFRWQLHNENNYLMCRIKIHEKSCTVQNYFFDFYMVLAEHILKKYIL